MYNPTSCAEPQAVMRMFNACHANSETTHIRQTMEHTYVVEELVNTVKGVGTGRLGDMVRLIGTITEEAEVGPRRLKESPCSSCC